MIVQMKCKIILAKLLFVPGSKYHAIKSSRYYKPSTSVFCQIRSTLNKNVSRKTNTMNNHISVSKFFNSFLNFLRHVIIY